MQSRPSLQGHRPSGWVRKPGAQPQRRGGWEVEVWDTFQDLPSGKGWVKMSAPVLATPASPPLCIPSLRTFDMLVCSVSLISQLGCGLFQGRDHVPHLKSASWNAFSPLSRSVWSAQFLLNLLTWFLLFWLANNRFPINHYCLKRDLRMSPENWSPEHHPLLKHFRHSFRIAFRAKDHSFENLQLWQGLIFEGTFYSFK